MNRTEAKWLMLRELAQWRRRPYGELRGQLGQSHHEQRLGCSGTRYQLELEAIWDAKPEGDIRILAAIDDGGLRAFFPLAYSVPVCRPSQMG